MEIKASLNNLRISPRKARLVTGLVAGMPISLARAQLTFLVKKPAPLILKLLNSAAANAKHDFETKEDNLYIKSILVEAGPSLKRWLPRAMGRATPLLKRTCSVKLILDEKVPSGKKRKKVSKPELVKPEEVLSGGQIHEEKIEREQPENKVKTPPPQRPYGATPESKKRFFSRQTFGNIKRAFRRKSI
jgi:large subunit ribosomal protein L22